MHPEALAGSENGARSFIELLRDFLLNPSGNNIAEEPLGHLVFAIAAAVVGLVVVSLDWMNYYGLGRKSLLGLSYHGWRILAVFLVYGMGAGFAGFLACIIGIVNLNLQACATVGIGWPAILPRIVHSAKREEDTQIDLTEILYQFQ